MRSATKPDGVVDGVRDYYSAPVLEHLAPHQGVYVGPGEIGIGPDTRIGIQKIMEAERVGGEDIQRPADLIDTPNPPKRNRSAIVNESPRHLEPADGIKASLLERKRSPTDGRGRGLRRARRRFRRRRLRLRRRTSAPRDRERPVAAAVSAGAAKAAAVVV